MKMQLVPNSGRLRVFYMPQTMMISHITMLKIFLCYLEGLGEIIRVSQSSRPPSRKSNPGPSYYEAKV
jgi:hypothetical protein